MDELGCVLIGRQSERRRIETAMTDGRTTALVLRGDAGIGKTALLEAATATAMATGRQVVRVRASQFESAVVFGGVSQLVLPIWWAADDLDPGQRAVLGVALGFVEGGVVQPVTLASAIVLALRSAARHRPVVVAVDDAQWLDAASRQVFALVARRLADPGVVALVATRDEPGADPFDGLETLRVGGLPEDDAARLLETVDPGLPWAIRRRILREAAGNPLALVEFPTAFAAAGSRAVPGTTMPMTDRLRAVVADRVAGLDVGVRELAVLVALDEPRTEVELTALRGPSVRSDLATAVAARVLRRSASGHVEFPHPLVRWAAVDSAGPATVRATHRLLAEAGPAASERAVRHRAASLAHPDDDVADDLERISRAALRRGAVDDGVATMIRAAELTSDPLARARRLAGSAHVLAGVSGDLGAAGTFLDAAALVAGADDAGLAAPQTALLLFARGEGRRGAELLVRAVRAGADALDPSQLADLLWMLALASRLTDDADITRVAGEIVRAHAADADEPYRAATEVAALGIHAPIDSRARLHDAVDRIDEERDLDRVLRVAYAAHEIDALDRCRAAVERVARAGRRDGAAGIAIPALVLQAVEAFERSAFAEFEATAAEALALAVERDYALHVSYVRYRFAMLAAIRGEDDRVRALSRELLAWAVPRGAGAIADSLHQVECLAALARGDAETAYQHAVTVLPDGSDTGGPLDLRLGFDLVEAAVRSGRVAEAAHQVDRMRALHVDELSQRQVLLVDAAEALVLGARGDDRATATFERALAGSSAGAVPFERARVGLLLGEHLRRGRDARAARRHLRAAESVFDALGAAPWAARASAELRATGETRRADAFADAELTPQERHVAELAASGLTNRAIADRLFLSSRTVGNHLYKIFPKLGVTTRAGLRDALAQVPAD